MTAADLSKAQRAIWWQADEVGRGPLAGDVVAAAVILAESPRGRHRFKNINLGAAGSPR